MTIGALYNQPVAGVGYQTGNVYHNPAPRAAETSPAEGVAVDTLRAIDILLGQLEQINQELAASQARTEAAVSEATAEMIAGGGSSAVPEADAEGAQVYGSAEERFDALLERYAEFRLAVEDALSSNPFASANTYAGMLFGIAA